MCGNMCYAIMFKKRISNLSYLQYANELQQLS